MGTSRRMCLGEAGGGTSRRSGRREDAWTPRFLELRGQRTGWSLEAESRCRGGPSAARVLVWGVVSHVLGCRTRSRAGTARRGKGCAEGHLGAVWGQAAGGVGCGWVYGSRRRLRPKWPSEALSRGRPRDRDAKEGEGLGGGCVAAGGTAGNSDPALRGRRPGPAPCLVPWAPSAMGTSRPSHPGNPPPLLTPPASG